jgi:hypothetical protein
LKLDELATRVHFGDGAPVAIDIHRVNSDLIISAVEERSKVVAAGDTVFLLDFRGIDASESNFDFLSFAVNPYRVAIVYGTSHNGTG